MSVFLNKLLYWQKYALFVSRLYLVPHSTLKFFLIGRGGFELLAARSFFILFLNTSRMFSVQKQSCPVNDGDDSDIHLLTKDICIFGTSTVLSAAVRSSFCTQKLAPEESDGL